MPFGQSYALYRITSGVTKLTLKCFGASEDTAECFAVHAGAMVGVWTACITGDALGGIGMATDVATRVAKSAEEGYTKEKGGSS